MGACPCYVLALATGEGGEFRYDATKTYHNAAYSNVRELILHELLL